MTGVMVILIIFAVMAATVGGAMMFFFGRIIWAKRNPEAFKAFEEREAARRQKYGEVKMN